MSPHVSPPPTPCTHACPADGRSPTVQTALTEYFLQQGARMYAFASRPSRLRSDGFFYVPLSNSSPQTAPLTFGLFFFFLFSPTRAAPFWFVFFFLGRT